MEEQQVEQSGKQIAFGVLAFIVGTIIILYLIKAFFL